VEPLICCWGETQTQGLADSLRHFWLEVAVDAGVSINRGLSPIMADRKSNRMRAIMTHVLGITGLQPGSA
jgi:hypothetical protein